MPVAGNQSKKLSGQSECHFGGFGLVP